MITTGPQKGSGRTSTVAPEPAEATKNTTSSHSPRNNNNNKKQIVAVSTLSPSARSSGTGRCCRPSIGVLFIIQCLFVIGSFVAVILVLTEQQRAEFKAALFERLRLQAGLAMHQVYAPMARRQQTYTDATVAFLSGPAGPSMVVDVGINATAVAPFFEHFYTIAARDSFTTTIAFTNHSTVPITAPPEAVAANRKHYTVVAVDGTKLAVCQGGSCWGCFIPTAAMGGRSYPSILTTCVPISIPIAFDSTSFGTLGNLADYPNGQFTWGIPKFAADPLRAPFLQIPLIVQLQKRPEIGAASFIFFSIDMEYLRGVVRAAKATNSSEAAIFGYYDWMNTTGFFLTVATAIGSAPEPGTPDTRDAFTQTWRGGTTPDPTLNRAFEAARSVCYPAGHNAPWVAERRAAQQPTPFGPGNPNLRLDVFQRGLQSSSNYSRYIVNNPCATALVEEVGTSENAFVLAAVRLVADEYLDTMLVQYTPRAHFFAASDNARLQGILIGVAAAIVVVAMCVLVFASIWFPLQRLVLGMGLAADMRNDEVCTLLDGEGGGSANGGNSARGSDNHLGSRATRGGGGGGVGCCALSTATPLLSEMAALSRAFIAMNTKLLLARPFLPPSLLLQTSYATGVTPSEEEEENQVDDDDEDDEGDLLLFSRPANNRSTSGGGGAPRISGPQNNHIHGNQHIQHSYGNNNNNNDSVSSCSGGDDDAASQRSSSSRHRHSQSRTNPRKGSLRQASTGDGNSSSSASAAAAELSPSPRISPPQHQRQQQPSPGAVVAGSSSGILVQRRVAILAINTIGFHDVIFSASSSSICSGTGLVAAYRVLAELVEQCVGAERGIIDSFHGDRFVAAFNTARPCGSAVQRAAAAALSLEEHFYQTQKVLLATNKTAAVTHSSTSSSISSPLPGAALLPTGGLAMGLSGGRALVGNMGTAMMQRLVTLSPAYSAAMGLLEVMTRSVIPRHHRCAKNDAAMSESRNAMTTSSDDGKDKATTENENTENGAKRPHTQISPTLDGKGRFAATDDDGTLRRTLGGRCLVTGRVLAEVADNGGGASFQVVGAVPSSRLGGGGTLQQLFHHEPIFVKTPTENASSLTSSQMAARYLVEGALRLARNAHLENECIEDALEDAAATAATATVSPAGDSAAPSIVTSAKMAPTGVVEVVPPTYTLIAVLYPPDHEQNSDAEEEIERGRYEARERDGGEPSSARTAAHYHHKGMHHRGSLAADEWMYELSAQRQRQQDSAGGRAMAAANRAISSMVHRVNNRAEAVTVQLLAAVTTSSNPTTTKTLATIADSTSEPMPPAPHTPHTPPHHHSPPLLWYRMMGGTCESTSGSRRRQLQTPQATLQQLHFPLSNPSSTMTASPTAQQEANHEKSSHVLKHTQRRSMFLGFWIWRVLDIVAPRTSADHDDDDDENECSAEDDNMLQSFIYQ